MFFINKGFYIRNGITNEVIFDSMEKMFLHTAKHWRNWYECKRRLRQIYAHWNTSTVSTSSQRLSDGRWISWNAQSYDPWDDLDFIRLSIRANKEKTRTTKKIACPKRAIFSSSNCLIRVNKHPKININIVSYNRIFIAFTVHTNVKWKLVIFMHMYTHTETILI